MYNNGKEFNKWKKWKQREEELLRLYNCDEKTILKLRQYDKNQFNKERSFRRYQNVTSSNFFDLQPFDDKREIKNIEDILNVIENESLYEYLKRVDPICANIILLKIEGYSVKEISNILKIPLSSIYFKIKKIKDFL